MIDVIKKLDKVNGRMNLRKAIAVQLINTSNLLGVQLEDDIIMLLSDTIIDKYLFDSWEDVIVCLHKASHGSYPFWGKIEMSVISKWMELHLEDKARVLEQQSDKVYPHQWEGETPAERRKSYEKAVQLGSIINKEIGESKNQAKIDLAAEELKQAEFEKFRKEYHTKKH